MGLELLASATETPDTALSRRVLGVLTLTTPQPAGTGNDRAGAGDLQNRLVAWARARCPGLLQDAVRALPELSVPMPVLAQTAARLQAAHGRPLAQFNTLVIGHVLGEMQGFIDALEEVGLDRSTSYLLAVPYSSNELAIEAMRARGYVAENPQGAVETAARGVHHGPRWGDHVDANTAFRGADPKASFDTLKNQTVHDALHRMLDTHAKNGRPILVIDDGGYAAKVAGETLTKEQLQHFRFVEQTTRGMRQIRTSAIGNAVVVDVAGSRVKRFEDPFVADLITDSLAQTMTQLSGGQLQGKRVAVLGYGNIGASVVARLRTAGAEVTVYDASDDARRRAARDGFNVVNAKAMALSGQQFVIGTTGNTSLNAEEFLELDANTTLVSTSSVDIEFRDSWTIADQVAQARRAIRDALHIDAPALPSPPNLNVHVRINAPGLRVDGAQMTNAQLAENRIVRSFVESLQEGLRPFGNGVNVSVKATYGVSDRLGRVMERITDEMNSPMTTTTTTKPTSPSSSPALVWGTRGQVSTPTMATAPAADVQERIAHELLESTVTLTGERGAVWLANGGYPVNLSRRLQSMPPERIQVTLAALLAGAVQATTSTSSGILPLDDTMQTDIERSFRQLAPAAFARATSGSSLPGS